MGKKNNQAPTEPKQPTEANELTDDQLDGVAGGTVNTSVGGGKTVGGISNGVTSSGPTEDGGAH